MYIFMKVVLKYQQVVIWKENIFKTLRKIILIYILQKSICCQLSFKRQLKWSGYSDHSKGFEAALIALSYGARIFEKHFTINNKQSGPDHSSSLSPKELKIYIEKLNIFKNSIGKYQKRPSEIELKNLRIVRKQIVAKKKIFKGEKFTSNNITTKRAEKGISASRWDKLIGKKSKYNFLPDENIKV